jgi:hypothetical protein
MRERNRLERTENCLAFLPVHAARPLCEALGAKETS